ncbi:hypothetical protein [Natrarchaeobaculum sulfurireducens]|uniref:Uncharacterized protein n=1 Tax=Natrarchaeobaculum sulfurireducens TaxID=2044521 RepID=A0A346PPR9_9EURY|nr:hypothetical protein [Natrarchaeobaculum sulfurireducens]AXR81514.1 hypothetical protein AArcMg_1501 [Natrarchaeobaculum sulfurireducens]
MATSQTVPDDRPSTHREWQEEAYDTIKHCAINGGRHLLDILMALGKTYAAGNLAADPEVDKPITVLTGETDTRDQVQEYAVDAGVDPDRIKMLPRFVEDCPTRAGEHDDEHEVPGWEVPWSELLEMLQRQQLSPSQIHERLGEHIPCQHEGRCEYAQKCDFDEEEMDLIIGHPIHANVERYVEDRIVLFDEDAADAFQYEVDQATYTEAVNAFLQNHADEIGASSFDDLIRATDDEKEQWISTIEENYTLLDPQLGYSSQGCRADVPLLTIAILNGENVETDDVVLENMRRTEIGDIVLLYDEGKGRNDPMMMVRNPPNPLSSAWSVVAMDGTPKKSVWEGGLGMTLDHDEFMTPGERETYIRDILNYDIIQLTPDRTVPAAKPDNVKRWVLNGFLHDIKERHDEMVPVIAPNKTKKSKVESRYVKSKELHHGKVRSHSEYEDEQLLAVLGSQHPGDRVIQRWAALDGHAVESNGESSVNKSYGPIGDDYYEYLVHNEVAQAIFRAGRSEDVDGATIYVYTCLIPDWVPRRVVTEKPAKWSEEMKLTMRTLKDLGSAPKERLVNETDQPDRTVRRHLNTLQDEGAVENVSGYGGYDEWVDTGIRNMNPHGQFAIDP